MGSGWSHCVVEVRHALDQWNKIEPVKMLPADQPRKEWAKKDRLDGLRRQLRECTHPAAHGESWSRDEALLMLSTLSALLAVRNP